MNDRQVGRRERVRVRVRVLCEVIAAHERARADLRRLETERAYERAHLQPGKPYTYSDGGSGV